MALDTQRFFAIETGMIIVVGALAGMATRTGHDLPRSRVEDIFTDRMRKLAVLRMAFAADLVNRALGHGWMVRAVRGMAVVTGVGHHMIVFSRLMPFESGLMTSPADMPLFALEQPFIISGMGRMTGDTAIFLVTHQMVMRRGHLFRDIRMTLEAGINRDRFSFAGMAIRATFSKRRMQNVSHQRTAVTAMRVVAGTAIVNLCRKTGMLLLNTATGMTVQAQGVGFFDEEVCMARLMRHVTCGALSLGKRRMGVFELPGHLCMTAEAGCSGLIDQQCCLI